MNFRRIHFCVLLETLISFSQPVHAAAPSSSPDSGDAKAVVSQETPSVLPYIRRAKKAAAWKMAPKEPSDGNRQTFVKVGTPVELNSAQLSRLQAELGNPENIGGSYSFCPFLPYVAVILEGDGFSMELQFCFGCDVLRVLLGGEFVKEVDISPGRASFLKVFKDVFPGDRGLQALPLKNPDAETKTK